MITGVSITKRFRLGLWGLELGKLVTTNQSHFIRVRYNHVTCLPFNCSLTIADHPFPRDLRMVDTVSIALNSAAVLSRPVGSGCLERLSQTSLIERRL